MIIRRLFKICDLYGTRFHWFIGYKPKSHTVIGGIFSIFSIFSWIIIFILLGFENFKRTHPLISTSTFPSNEYKNIKFGEKKLYLPWRIIDYDERFINHKGLIYPKIYYFTRTLNKTTGEINTNYTLLNYKICNETSMKYLGKEFLLDINLGELFCIDMEDLNMGGNWNTNFLNYVRFDLYLCQNGSDYNETNNKCSSFDEFEKLFGKDNSLFFELLFPIVQFQPTEEEMPLLIVYQAYYYLFTKYSNKLDRIYLKEYILEDEKGWIFNTPKRVSYWGTDSLEGDNFVRNNEKDFVHKGSTSRLYSLKIYLNLGITYYTRKYKKLWEIFSEIFPIIKAIIAVFTFITECINDIYSFKKLNELIIGINKVPDKKIKYNFNIMKEKKIKNFTNIITYSHTPKNENSKSKEIFRFKFQNGKKNSNVIIPNGNDSNLGLKLKNNNNLASEFSEYLDKNSSKMNKTERILYPIKYYLYGFILIKLRSKKNHYSLLPERFRKSFSFLIHLIDISSYIKLYKHFENVQKIVMNIISKDEPNYKRNDSIISIRKVNRKISAI
jgi:hypothetical protein